MSQLALRWLREVLKIEFSPAPSFHPQAAGASDGAEAALLAADSGAEVSRTRAAVARQDPLGIAMRFERGNPDDARWYRDWHERWRRFQVPLQFSRYIELLSEAETPDAVFRTLAECAVGMVGGYTCLVFPAQEGMPLRPLPNAVLRIDPDRLTLSVPLSESGTLRREDVLSRSDNPLASLAPLFSEERVVSVAYAPFGDGGVILLVERRERRCFDVEDQELLCVLAAHAAAALARVGASTRNRQWCRIRVEGTILGEADAAAVLDHAIAIAEQGEPLAIARLELHGLERVAAEDGELAAERIRRTAADVLREMAGSLGIPLHQGNAEFLLVLPRRGPTHIELLIGSLQRQLPHRVHVRAGVAAYQPGDRATQLLARSRRTLDEPRTTPAAPRAVPTRQQSLTLVSMSHALSTSVRSRRQEDRDLSLHLAQPVEDALSRETPVPAGRQVLRIHDLRINPRAGLPGVETLQQANEMEDEVFLLDVGAEEAILVAGAAVRRIPRGGGGDDMITRAAVGAAGWRRERLRASRRAELPELLVAFSEQLTRAESESDVFRALVEYTPRIVGGYTAAVLAKHDGRGLQAVSSPHVPYDTRHFRLPRLPRFARPGTISAADARADTGGPFAELGPLFAEIHLATIAHVPFEPIGVLAVLDRRHDRVFEPDEWELLGALSRQAAAAVQRVRLFHEVHSLSLSDPLTGLANRRHMAVVLDRALAAARRGEGLSVVMFDLDRFKEINDQQGHPAGDRILITVAEALRREARGADLVVRYGGDEFLVVMPGTTMQGAHSFIGRVRDRLEGEIEVSAGVAEYAPHIATGEQIIEAADQSLYSVKQQRKRPGR